MAKTILDWILDKKRLGVYLQALRAQKAWSLDRLSEETHISKGNLSEMENGKKRPGEENLEQLARVYALSAQALLIDSGAVVASVPRTPAVWFEVRLLLMVPCENCHVPIPVVVAQQTVKDQFCQRCQRYNRVAVDLSAALKTNQVLAEHVACLNRRVRVEPLDTDPR